MFLVGWWEFCDLVGHAVSADFDLDAIILFEAFQQEWIRHGKGLYLPGLGLARWWNPESPQSQ